MVFIEKNDNTMISIQKQCSKRWFFVTSLFFPVNQTQKVKHYSYVVGMIFLLLNTGLCRRGNGFSR